MGSINIDDAQAGKRTQPRTHMFVMASLSAASAAGPVKIRNLSTDGALIEGAQLPNMGEALELRRAELFASGRITWKSPGKAGVKLDRPINVDEWLPAGHSGQRAVDQAFQLMKSGSGEQFPTTPAATGGQQDLEASQLRQAARSLDDLANALASDPEIVARHATKLQILDIAAQLLRKIALEE